MTASWHGAGSPAVEADVEVRDSLRAAKGISKSKRGGLRRVRVHAPGPLFDWLTHGTGIGTGAPLGGDAAAHVGTDFARNVQEGSHTTEFPNGIRVKNLFMMS